MEKPFFGWAAQYLVMERVVIESNFHSLYLQFVLSLDNSEYVSQVLSETFHNIRVSSKSNGKIFFCIS